MRNMKQGKLPIIFLIMSLRIYNLHPKLNMLSTWNNILKNQFFPKTINETYNSSKKSEKTNWKKN